ncbi:MAG TPA: polymorphic toxin-type HINT domain-containing protein [Candidatus Limnocylindrales bacterium]
MKAPVLSGEGNKAEAYTLAWDVFDTVTNNWKSASHQLPQLPQQIRIEDPTSDLLGLEKFYSYEGKSTGGGGTAMNNLYAGNTTWSYNAFSNPSRGLSTFVRMTYNSLDTSASSMGFGWSLQTSTIQRLGSQLSFHPPGQKWPTQVRATDGDGTTNVWVLETYGRDAKDCTPSTCDYKHPRGVHLYLQQTGSADPTRTWVFTRPDRTQFFFDDDGFQSAIVDKNGNTLSFTYERRKSNNKPTKFLRYITDPDGRRTLTVDYYEKGEATFPYVDDNTWQDATGTSLTNPFIIDSIKSITDVSGRRISFTYTLKGLMAKMVDGDGSINGVPKTFRFQYDMTQGNKNVKLVKTTDPRGNDTRFAYYTAPVDPQNKWKLADLTDRLLGVTHFEYLDPDGPQGGTIHATVTDAELNKTQFQMDNFARPFRVTNAKNEVTNLIWDGDHNVTQLTEPNNAVSSWQYDPKTGYPLVIKDAESVKNNWPGTRLDYATSLNGNIADLSSKASSEGRTWQFGYDARGNLTSVTDPLGVDTATPDDFTSVSTYDALGQLVTEKDANGNITRYAVYHATGSPREITDALQAKSTFVYDERGNVTELRNAKQAKTTQTYDTFGRPLDRVEPVDAAANRFLTTRAPEYDPNDNITTAFAANGTSTTSVYDKADQMIESLAPKDEPGDPERKTTTTYDKVGNILTETEPEGNLTPTAGDFTTTTRYDAIYQPIEMRDGTGRKVTTEYDNVGNVRTLIDAKKNATPDPADFTFKYEYDLNHMVTKAIDAKGEFTTSRYDRDGLMVGFTDAERNETLSIYNKRGDITDSKVPHKKDAAGNITYRTSRFDYDQVGNQTKVVTPRGFDTQNDPTDFTQTTVYDALNRKKEVWSAFDEQDPRYNQPDKVIYEYDEVGNQTKVSAPPSEGQTVRNDSVYTYFENGWQRTAKDQWNILTSFEYNDLGQQIKNTLSPAGTTPADAAARTMTWEYFPSGNQKSRSDDGLPVGRDVVLVDSSDSNNTSSQGTWTSGTASGQYGYDVYTAAAGTGSAQFNYQLNIPRDGTYEVFVQYPQISGAATDAKFTVTHSGGSTTKTINQTINPSTWVSLGSFSFTEDAAQKVTLTNQANGRVIADVVKLVRSNAGEADTEKKTFTYKYNSNGLMTEVRDLSPNVSIDKYKIAYDQLSQVTKVEEFAPGATTPKNTTEQTYDLNSNLETMKHNLTWSKVDYDVRDMISTVTNADSPTAGNRKISTFTYTARGDMLKQVKPNGNTVDFEYYLDGSIKHQVEKTRSEAVVAEHSLEYNANGNPSKDVLRLMNADNAADIIDNTYTFDYDPQDRVTKVTKTGDSSATEEYVYDGNGNVVDQTVDSVRTTNKYDRNRLHSSTAAGITSTYNYDPLGRLDTVTMLGERTQKYYYDGFDRTAKVTAGIGAAAKTTTYVYDPFDRTVSQAEGDKTTTFTYLALDKQTLREDVSDDADTAFQYAPWGEKLTQIKHKEDGTQEVSQFTYRPRGDVIAITKDDGTTRSTYGYSAYGKNDESQMTGEDKPDASDPEAEPYNSYRYNSSRFDPGSGTYDMGFRNYDPGLNRFLTRDYYGGAMSDMDLSTDPYTNNRYAFAGGNPISYVELDGHLFGMSWSDIGHAALDIVGMVPVVGEVADVANGIWYMAEGNYVDGAMSLASAIPLAGNVVGAAKLAKTGKKVYDAVDTSVDAARNVDNAVDAAKQVDNAVDASRAATPPKTPGTPDANAPPAPKKPVGCNSFVPGTRVLLADGSAKPIEQVQVGDEVLASDVETNERQARPVTALIPGNGVKHLYTITIDSDGASGDQTGQVIATADHRFWLPDAGKWVTAKHLQPGMWLQTGSGTWVQITQVEHEIKRQQVHNFTVDGVHSYYVAVGAQSVLVHNDACPTDQKLLADAKAIHGQYQIHKGAEKAKYAQDHITVVTAHIGGKKYYSVSSNKIDDNMKAMAEALGYTRVHGARFLRTNPKQTHAEHIMLNALKRKGNEHGFIKGSGRMAPSRKPCAAGTKSYQACADRVKSTRGIKLVGWG